MDMQFCAQPGFAPVFSFPQDLGPNTHYQHGQYSVYQDFHGLQYMYPPQQPRNQLMPERHCDGKNDSKPRLSKEEVEKLEKIFQENSKPSSSVKAQLADALNLERPRINNWFQNRRAKAKQERKQEEYEARRAAEKASTSEPNSPADLPSGVGELFKENVRERMKPSTVHFPDMSPAPITTDTIYDDTQYEEDDASEDDAEDAVDFASPFSQQLSKSYQENVSAEFQSPPSLDFSRPDNGEFTYSKHNQDFSHQAPVHDFISFAPSHQERRGGLADGLSSPKEQNNNVDYHADHYFGLVGTGYPSSTLPFFQATSAIENHKLEGTVEDEVRTPDDGSMQTEQFTPSISRGIPTPADSFKSPPPPANIASRRNIQRPAALNSAALRSRPYNLGCGPKTAMDGPRRADPTSPATAMRRIASTSGNMTGRIQKQSAGPRSPMFFNRKPEVLLQYHSRSPVNTLGAAFAGAAPPTPMTPMVMNQQSMREPTVSSSCSDDEAFMLGTSISASFLHDLKAESLKTPPGTPGLMTNFAAHNFSGNPFSAGIDFTADQPLLTPYFQSEFPELSMCNIPSYVEFSDNSLPSTPLYPNMMSSAQESTAFVGATLSSTRDYDWDANESVTSSKSSPDQSKSRAIQFTQHITPQDYTHER